MFFAIILPMTGIVVSQFQYTGPCNKTEFEYRSEGSDWSDSWIQGEERIKLINFLIPACRQ
jgi:hypothetical protein